MVWKLTYPARKFPILRRVQYLLCSILQKEIDMYRWQPRDKSHYGDCLSLRHDNETHTDLTGIAVVSYMCILQVFASNLGRNTGHPVQGFMVFSVNLGKFHSNTSVRSRSFHSTICDLSHHSTLYSPEYDMTSTNIGRAPELVRLPSKYSYSEYKTWGCWCYHSEQLAVEMHRNLSSLLLFLISVLYQYLSSSSTESWTFHIYLKPILVDTVRSSPVVYIWTLCYTMLKISRN